MRLLIEKCKAELEKSGVTTSDQRIAKTIGVSRALITKLKQGEIAHVRGELIDALCQVLRCKPCDLIEVEPVELPLAHSRPDLKVTRPFPGPTRRPAPAAAAEAVSDG